MPFHNLIIISKLNNVEGYKKDYKINYLKSSM